jgi:acid phosphatase
MRYFFTLLSALLFSTVTTRLFSQSIPQYDHVVICIMENHSYSQIEGSSSAPYINTLITDQNAATFTNSYGLTHPSQPNYIMLFSGDDQGSSGDGVPSGQPFTTCNLGAELLANDFTFAGYSEDLPSTGFNGETSGLYARKHSPWVNWMDAPTNGIPPSLHLSFADFPSDFSQLPTLSFVIPHLENDMHDPALLPSAISNGDAWIENNMEAYIQWAKTNNSLFILTFDEDNWLSLNHILTVFIGDNLIAGSYNQNIDHYDLLRTLEDMYGLNYCGNSATASPITDCWAQLSTGISIAENNLKNALVYPNPVNENLNIDMNCNNTEIVRIIVSNIMSQSIAVYENEVSAGQNQIKIPLDNFENGTYFVTITSSGKSEVKKIIIKN